MTSPYLTGFRYGEIPYTEVSIKTLTRAEEMVAFCRHALGIGAVEIRWFVPTAFKPAGYEFLSTFVSEDDMVGMARKDSPRTIWIRAHRWPDQTAATVAHECWHLTQFKGLDAFVERSRMQDWFEEGADKFVAWAMENADLGGSSLLIEHLTNTGRFSDESSRSEAGVRYEARASLETIGEALKASLQDLIRVCQDPKASALEINQEEQIANNLRIRFNALLGICEPGAECLKALSNTPPYV